MKSLPVLLLLLTLIITTTASSTSSPETSLLHHDQHCATTTTSNPKHPCFQYSQTLPSSLDEIDPRYGVAKRLVPSGPNGQTHG
ncbi:hypothetical protein L1987_80370 [Smallanthus sonchifolius]|uniref:Uncharacterized protein n=1 Tax=Smallanthus sonchifolius TaxID=185202 RepID=A0ACB8YME5_9ASTR|nr:hypothetical protein L1987_80370 [Smallanthus sonchifolius]